MIRKDGLRIVANYVMEDGCYRRFSNDALLSHADIVFQCVQIHKVAFTLEIFHVLGFTVNPFSQMVTS